ncbi:putative nucleic acid-binding Zn ribbon protein [Chitinophaga terrae (ex Kim and Jung 2007)]|jgi:predicted nucleic acid-binding Zn ribbon protein|nr:hypothetical protein [Chitinophaga terrae (ex Kim and Jung 2007)]MDQ0109685.1 putative nucleic acid-binding Zn ribbon protein [Chitinophaga terrae (ex Kim and Jung 2007)]
METTELINKNAKQLNRSRLMVKIILALVILLMAILQYDHLLQLLKWF